MRKSEVALRLKKARKPAQYTADQSRLSKIGTASAAGGGYVSETADKSGYGMDDIYRGEDTRRPLKVKTAAPQSIRTETASGALTDTSDVKSQIESLSKKNKELKEKTKKLKESTRALKGLYGN